MKKLNLLFVAIAAILMCSCSNKTNEELLQVVPYDATCVISVDYLKIVKNLGLKENNGKIEVPQEITSMLDPQGKVELDSAMSILASVGVDYQSKLMFFTDADMIHAYILTAIKDVEKTKTALEKLDVQFEKQEEVYLSNEIALKDNFMLIDLKRYGEEFATKAVNYLNKTYESIATNSDAKDVLLASNDVNAWFNYKKMLSSSAVNRYMRTSDAALFANLVSGLEGVGMHFSFDNDEVNTNVKIFTNDDGDYMKLMKKIKGDASDDFLKYMPEDANLLCYVGINGEEIAEFEQVKTILANAQSSVANINLIDFVASIKGIGFGLSADIDGVNVKGSLCIMTDKGAQLAPLINTFISFKSDLNSKLKAEANSEALYIYGGTIEPNVKLGVTDSRKKDLFDSSYAAYVLDIPYDGKTIHIDFSSSNVTESKGVLKITQGNKNVPFLQYPAFFGKLLSSKSKKGVGVTPASETEVVPASGVIPGYDDSDSRRQMMEDGELEPDCLDD